MSVCFLLLDSSLSHLYAPFGTARSLHCIFSCLFSTGLLKWTNAAVKKKKKKPYWLSDAKYGCVIRKVRFSDIQWYLVPTDCCVMRIEHWITNTVLTIWWADAGASEELILKMSSFACEQVKNPHLIVKPPLDKQYNSCDIKVCIIGATEYYHKNYLQSQLEKNIWWLL